MLASSLLISGPVLSRIKSQNMLEEVKASLKMFKNININNEIIISTYEGEVNEDIKALADKIIINQDPGQDKFRNSPWPIGNNNRRYSANYSRILSTTFEGILACNNNIVLKTRVELLPIRLDKYSEWFVSASNKINNTQLPLIGFFTEHYNGISFSIDGVLGTIPDTFQIGRKEILLDIWSTSKFFWEKNRKLLTRKRVRFPITIEQILGMNYLYLYSNFSIHKRITNLRRYYLSPGLIKSILEAEQSLFIYLEYKQSGFTVNYLKGTFYIRVPKVIFQKNYLIILKKLIIVLLKRVKHHYRKYKYGFTEKVKYHFTE